ncbi:MAG: hypothetical protein QOE26_1038 [Verrucomicrobiota bacterium]|jgi:hypothetical protein
MIATARIARRGLRFIASTSLYTNEEGWIDIVNELNRHDLFQPVTHALSGCFQRKQ